MSQKIHIGARLRAERERLGLTQSALGVTPQAQRKYERGDRSPDAEYLFRLAEAGGDVLFVLSGTRNAALLSADEVQVLDGFRAMDARGRAAVLAMMCGYTAQLAGIHIDGQVGQAVTGTATGPVNMNVTLKAASKKR